MRVRHIKNSISLFVIITLSLASLLTYGYVSRNTAGAAMTLQGITLPNASIFGLTSDNTLFVLTPGTSTPTRVGRVSNINGNLIGIDFRPADGKLYGLTDTGNLYTITTGGVATLVSTLSPRFAGGFQSLMDFNPVVDAIRLIGTNDQNYAVVKTNGGPLGTTATQTALTYPAGDANAGTDPNITGGSYTNNFAGATSTLFYAIDYDLDTFVTIAPLAGAASSNTGGGQLQTLGKIVDASGAPINIAPTADLDIFTDANGVNSLVVLNGLSIMTIDLAQITPNQAPGTTKNIIAQSVTLPSSSTTSAGFIDIAIATAAPGTGQPTPTPTATATPKPSPTATATPKPSPTATPKPSPTPTPAPAATYEAEYATLYLAKVDTVHKGFSGAGFVDYADGRAGGYVEFALPQTGTKTLTIRYANGSTQTRTLVITLNGTKVGTVSFAPTGAWPNYKTLTTTVNFGTATGKKALRFTAATTAGGPNFDRLDVN
jgi:hypothetical protein